MRRLLYGSPILKAAVRCPPHSMHVRFLSQYRSPYSVLGLQAGASEAEVKKAYKKLALKWHPDRNDSPGAEQKFKEISEAYTAITKGGGANPFGGGSNSSYQNPNSRAYGGFQGQPFGFGTQDPHELFRQMFQDQVRLVTKRVVLTATMIRIYMSYSDKRRG